MRRLTVLLADLDDTAPHRSVLELLRWAKGRAEADIEVVSQFDGDCRDRFADAAPLHVVNPDRSEGLPGRLQTVRLDRIADGLRSRELRVRLADLDAVWLADPGAAALLQWAGVAASVTSHLHRSAVWPTLAPEVQRMLLDRTTLWIAGDAPAAATVGAMAGVPLEQVAIRPDFLESGRQIAHDVPLDRVSRRARTRAGMGRSGIDPDAPLVISSGRVDFGHGTNRFAPACWAIHLAQPELGTQFAWVADGSTSRMLDPLRRQIEQAGLTASVHVIEGGPPLLEVLAAADAYIATDPAPVTADLTADLARLGVPQITGTGPGMTARVIEVIDPERRVTSALARTDDWDVQTGGPNLLRSLLS